MQSSLSSLCQGHSPEANTLALALCLTGAGRGWGAFDECCLGFVGHCYNRPLKVEAGAETHQSMSTEQCRWHVTHFCTLAALAPPAAMNCAANCFPETDVTRAEANVRGGPSLSPCRKSIEHMTACITLLSPSTCSTLWM